MDLSVNSLEVLGRDHGGGTGSGARSPRVHIAVDTGLGREGVTMTDLPGVLELAKAAERGGHRARRRHVVASGVGRCSWAPDDRPSGPGVQAGARDGAGGVPGAGGAASGQLRVHPHAARTCTSTWCGRASRCTGALPSRTQPGDNFGLAPAMRVTSHDRPGEGRAGGPGRQLRARVRHHVSHHAGPGERGLRRWRVPRGGSVAEVSVRGRRYRIAGRVCMDQFVIDLGSRDAT